MFDVTVNDFVHTQSDEIEMYRKRRENACAFWATIPEKDFNFSKFISSCGTTACAIGWLASKQIDGWYFDTDILPRHDGNYALVASRKYFGIAVYENIKLFGAGSRNFFAKPIEQVTLSDISDALMSMPYMPYVMEKAHV